MMTTLLFAFVMHTIYLYIRMEMEMLYLLKQNETGGVV